MNRLHLGRKLTILATAASLAGAGAAVGPATASAHAGGTSCGSKTIAVPAGGKTVRVAASRITVSGGATCGQADTVIKGYVQHKTPKGWTVKEGTFAVPHGLTAETAKKGKMTVQFALVGGDGE
jgi:hypothetical protein